MFSSNSVYSFLKCGVLHSALVFFEEGKDGCAGHENEVDEHR